MYPAHDQYPAELASVLSGHPAQQLAVVVKQACCDGLQLNCTSVDPHALYTAGAHYTHNIDFSKSGSDTSSDSR